MALPPYSTVGGYGGPLILSDGASLSDTEDGVPAFVPAFNPTGPAALAQAIISPVQSAYGGTPIQNALLVEIRVMNALIALQMGASAPDLEQMRANELFDCSLGTALV